jgi:hypothetical protein
MRRRILWLVPALGIVLTVGVLLLPGGGQGVGTLAPDTAAARRVISIPFGFTSPSLFGFDEVRLRHNDRQVDVTGRAHCEEPLGHFRVDVVVEQDGLVALGHRQEACTGAEQTWTVRAVVRGPGAFRADIPATGHGEIRLLYRGGESQPIHWEWGPNRLDR